MTNNGAVIAVSPSARRVEWAFSCEGPTIAAQPRWFGPDMVIPSAPAPGALLLRDGVLFIKESGAPNLFALDLSGPKIKWRRPLDSAETLAGISNDQLITIGQDVCAIELEHQKMLWSSRLPAGSSSGVLPVLAGDSVCVFAARGIYKIDLKSGGMSQVFRGADHDSAGGSIQSTGSKFITISNQAVTAYPLTAQAARVQ